MAGWVWSGLRAWALKAAADLVQPRPPRGVDAVVAPQAVKVSRQLGEDVGFLRFGQF